MSVRQESIRTSSARRRIGTAAVAVAVAAVPVGSTLVSAAASAAPSINPPAGRSINPPAGSVKVKRAKGPGVLYTRYRTSMAPTAVTAFYAKRLHQSGYRVSGPTNTSTTSVVYGQKSKQYAAIQAGGSNPTYFEVCVGKNRTLVNKCDSPSGAS